MKMSSCRRIALLGAALSLPAGAQAVVLEPGGSAIVSTAGTSVAEQPHLAGTVVEDRTTPFAYEGWFRDSSFGEDRVWTGTVSGNVQSRVVLAVDGTYDFHWRIAVDPTSFLSVAHLGLSGWAPDTFEVDWFRDDGSGVVPAGVQQPAAGGPVWFFGQFLPPSHLIRQGEHSVWFFVDTEAQAYAPGSFVLASERDSGGSMMISWGGVSAALSTFAPAQAVPEPASLLTMLGGLALLGLGAGRQIRQRADATIRRCLPADPAPHRPPPRPPTPPSRAISARA